MLSAPAQMSLQYTANLCLIDPRTERHEDTVFKNLRINDETTELDVFLALLPLSPEKLLEIVRDGSARSGDRLKWNVDHIYSALCILFRAGQFKEGTDHVSVFKFPSTSLKRLPCSSSRHFLREPSSLKPMYELRGNQFELDG